MNNFYWVFVAFFAGSTVTQVQCGLKIWRYNQSIYNQKYWVPTEDEEDCEGLIFPLDTYGVLSLHEANVKEILLPVSGDILLWQDTNIIINETSSDKLNCALLNETDFSSLLWTDLANWITVGYEDNVAVPHMERLPCQYDDISFPAGLESRAVNFFGYNVKIKSFKFANEYWNNEDLAHYLTQQVTSAIFQIYGNVRDNLFMREEECEDPTGCVCGNQATNMNTCWTPMFFNSEVDIEKKFDCLDPIKPNGFCTEICGASILFKPRKTFNLEKFRQKLKQYSSDTYASKVEVDQSELIQVIFAEKLFTGTSLNEAKELHELLSTDPSLGARQAKLITSGPFYKEGAVLKSTLFSIFGTLSGVLAVFALLYILFATTFIGTIRNRTNFGSNPFSTHASKIFARYKASDAGLIIEVESRSESIHNLERAFENPMYERHSPSTSTTSDEAGPEVMNTLTKIEAQIENEPFPFEEQLNDAPKETELINLSSQNN